jgi:hypothetical protein
MNDMLNVVPDYLTECVELLGSVCSIELCNSFSTFVHHSAFCTSCFFTVRSIDCFHLLMNCHFCLRTEL